jgi:hypothetical protein
MEELQSHLFLDFSVEDLIDPAHSAFAQVFDDLVSPGEGRPGSQLFNRHLDGRRRQVWLLLRQGRRAIAARTGAGGIFKLAFRAFHPIFPSTVEDR